MYCRHCGKQIKDESLFCTYCGQAVKKAVPTVDNTVEKTAEVRVEVPTSTQVEKPAEVRAEAPASARVEAPTNAQVEKPQKKNKLVVVLVCIIVLLVAVIAVTGTCLVLNNRDNSEIQRTTWEDESDKDDEDDEDEDDEDAWDDEDVDEDEDETESDAEETENRDTAVANAEELDVTQLNGLIETLCASGNPIRNMLADPAGFSASFMLNSIGDEADVQRILDMYPDAYQKEYYLCMTEADVQDYLKNSVGLEEMSTLLEISGYENGYSSYEDGVFAMVRPDTGDFWIDEPVITEVKTVSDTEIVVSGEIRNGVAEDSATSFFEIVMTVNPDSIWGGYTLSAITRWDTYILPYVDSQYLTEEDIMNWDADYLRLARNEIYARHGRQFDDEGLQNYFETCNWYVGTTSASDFDEAALNEYELANRDLIVQYEAQINDKN